MYYLKKESDMIRHYKTFAAFLTGRYMYEVYRGIIIVSIERSLSTRIKYL